MPTVTEPTAHTQFEEVPKPHPHVLSGMLFLQILLTLTGSVEKSKQKGETHQRQMQSSGVMETHTGCIDKGVVLLTSPFTRVKLDYPACPSVS